jgi:hypothetical protein
MHISVPGDRDYGDRDPCSVFSWRQIAESLIEPELVTICRHGGSDLRFRTYQFLRITGNLEVIPDCCQ